MERPRVIRQMAEAVYGNRIDYARFAAEAHYPEAFIRDLISAHAGKDADQRKTEAIEQPLKSVLRFAKED
jgi:hypothetical protein